MKKLLFFKVNHQVSTQKFMKSKIYFVGKNFILFKKEMQFLKKVNIDISNSSIYLEY